jgi:hypothetical protein
MVRWASNNPLRPRTAASTSKADDQRTLLAFVEITMALAVLTPACAAYPKINGGLLPTAAES